MGKKDKPVSTGRIHIMGEPTLQGETFIITPMNDESQVYYLPVGSMYSSFVSTYIELPPRNYIVKLMGKDKIQLVTVTENGYHLINWLDAWL